MLALPKKWFNSSYRIAVIYAELDEKDQAFYWLEKAFEERYFWPVFLKVEPELDPPRDDPRFQDLLRWMNLPVEKYQQIQQNDNTAKAIEHYERFLSLWKGADPGVAEDANKKLAGLRNC